MNIFKKLYIRALSKYNANIDTRLLKRLLVGVPEANKATYEVLLKNELAFLNGTFVNQTTHKKEREQKEFYLQLTMRVIDRIMVLKNIIGMQPMQGPVGLVYLLQFAKSEQSSVRLEVQKEAVEALTRRLCAGWTIEAAQDFRTLHGIDIAAELQVALSCEIAEELIAEVVVNLQALGKKSPDNRITTVDSRDAMMIAINQASNSIAQKTRRGAGNFIVTSPMGVSLLQSDKYTSFVVPDTKSQHMELTSLVHAGDIMNKDNVLYPVYMSLAIKEEVPSQITFIVGYKGKNGDIDTGYIYSPYVPIMACGPVVDPATFQPVMKLMTRYGKTLVKATEESPVSAEDYYRTVVYDAAMERID